MARSFADDIRTFALSFEGAREEFSFGPDHPVFKAPNGKIFALAGDGEAGTHVSLKLTPDEVVEALTLPFVGHAPYLSKAHWVQSTITNDAELEATLQWIARSHELVTARPVRKRP